MNYLLDKQTIFKNRDAKKKTGQILAIIGLAGGLFFFGTLIYEPLAKTVLAASQPLLQANNTISRSLKNTLFFFSNQKSLIQENNRLKEVLRRREADLFQMRSQLNSQQKLVVFLQTFDQIAPAVLIPAIVTGRPRFTPYDVLLVSVPVKVKVKPGYQVFWSDNIILGQVISVAGPTVKIRLYSSSGFSHNVLIDSDSGSSTPAIMIGRGGGNFTIRLPRGVVVTKLARVVLADKPQLVVGIVGRIEKTAAQPSQTVYVKTPVNIYTLNQVIIKQSRGTEL